MTQESANRLRFYKAYITALVDVSMKWPTLGKGVIRKAFEELIEDAICNIMNETEKEVRALNDPT